MAGFAIAIVIKPLSGRGGLPQELQYQFRAEEEQLQTTRCFGEPPELRGAAND